MISTAYLVWGVSAQHLLRSTWVLCADKTVVLQLAISRNSKSVPEWSACDIDWQTHKFNKSVGMSLYEKMSHLRLEVNVGTQYK